MQRKIIVIITSKEHLNMITSNTQTFLGIILNSNFTIMDKVFEKIGEKIGNSYKCGRSCDGYVYKDEQAFVEKSGVCYIAECEFDMHGSDIIDVNPDDDNAAVSTYQSIIQEVKDLCNSYEIDNDMFVEYIAEWAFNEVDWMCISTYLNELDIEEEYHEWITQITK